MSAGRPRCAGLVAGCLERWWLLGMCISCFGQPISGLPHSHKSRSCSCPEEDSPADRVRRPRATYSSR